jgi:TIR domain
LEPRLVKPRVFLSHSKKDVVFIHRLNDDLRKCQIEPWMDEIEIRVGKPWLDAIFEDGIPTCDSVFVYLTERSVDSNMVKKEIDVGILQQLKDRRVAFIPYVENEGLRSRLRPDIQVLQVPVWSAENYNEVFPRFVAEVWRSFTERALHAVVQEEQNRRLKAELELEKLKVGQKVSIFSLSEDEDFKYIWQSFDKAIPVNISVRIETPGKNVTELRSLVSINYRMKLNLRGLIVQLTAIDSVAYRLSSLRQFVAEKAADIIKDVSAHTGKKRYETKEIADIKEQLLRFGLLQPIYVPPRDKMDWLVRGESYKFLYSGKMFRFIYWLGYNGLLPEGIEFDKAVELVPTNESDGDF